MRQRTRIFENRIVLSMILVRGRLLITFEGSYWPILPRGGRCMLYTCTFHRSHPIPFKIGGHPDPTFLTRFPARLLRYFQVRRWTTNRLPRRKDGCFRVSGSARSRFLVPNVHVRSSVRSLRYLEAVRGYPGLIRGPDHPATCKTRFLLRTSSGQ